MSALEKGLTTETPAVELTVVEPAQVDTLPLDEQVQDAELLVEAIGVALSAARRNMFELRVKRQQLWDDQA